MPVINIIGKLYSNKLLLPGGFLCSVILPVLLKTNSIDKKMEGFHYRSIILEQRVLSFLLLESVRVKTHVFLSEFDMILPLSLTLNILRSSHMNKEYRVKA